MRINCCFIVSALWLSVSVCIADTDIVLEGKGSGQVVAPNSFIREPLLVRTVPSLNENESPIRFSVISVPKGSEGILLAAKPTDESGSSEHLERLPQSDGEVQLWVKTGNREGAYIVTAEHPRSKNVVTFFVHARRPIWRRLLPVPVLVGLGLVAWGATRRMRSAS